METRARFVLMGLFTLAVIAAGFGFVYWLHYAGGLGAKTVYRIQFENSLAGVLPGSAVLFNGIRVGEVTELRLNRDNPREVMATISVERNTPVRADTRVSVYAQGLMGSPTIALHGGEPSAPLLLHRPGEPPLLVADPSAGQDVMQTARQVLQRLDAVVGENAEPLRNTIANLSTFSDVLVRNSERLESIAAGLERMVGGEPETAPPTIYDLTVPRTFPSLGKAPELQLVVAEPTAILLFDTQRVLLRSAGGEATSFAGAQWSDSLPHLFQTKIVQSFENAGYLNVHKPDGPAADRQLLIDIRSFQVLEAAEPLAEIEFAAKLIDGDDRIVDGRIFRAAIPAKALNAPVAVAALDEAFGKAVTELVVWAAGIP